MNLKKILPGILFLTIGAVSVFAEEPVKTEPAATEKKRRQ